MLLEVIKFEIRYRLNRPATYIYFFILLLLSFAAVSWDGINVGGDIGKIKQNSSFVLFNIAGVLSILPGLFFASAIMGVPILRDFEHKMESLIFTTNVDKFSYLGGRFIGSFTILLLISTSFFIGTFLGCHMPWLDKETLMSAGVMQYVRPWFMLMVSNLFIYSCIFFASGALSRKMLFVYLQAIVLLAVYFMAGTLIGDVENIEKAAIFDPFGYYALAAETRYWTVAEKNTLLVPFAGYMLKNRVLWMGIAAVLAALTYIVFKFRTVQKPLFRSRKNKAVKLSPLEMAPIPFAKAVYNTSSSLQQLFTLARLYFKETVRSVPFLGIGLIGLIILLVDAEYSSQWNGQELYPVTSMIAGFVASEIFPIILVMVLFYAGEIIWKEKQINFNQIFDSLPVSYSVPIVSKYLALAGMILLYLLAMVPIGIAIQLVKGFGNIDIGIYAIVLLTRVYISMLIYLAIMMFIQSVVSNKFIGYAVSILFYLYGVFAVRMKIFNFLLIPNSGSAGDYSEMNGFAAGLDKFIILKLYWAGIAIVLLVLAVLFYQRGTVSTFSERLRNVRQRFKGPQLLFMTVGLLLVLVSGTYYTYNVSMLNKNVDPEELKDLQVRYEKTLRKKYINVLQPSVTAILAKVELYPENGDVDLDANVVYKNLMPGPISELLVQLPGDEDISFSKLEFSVAAKLIKAYEKLRFKVYKLDTPLNPGDSLIMKISAKRINKGFKSEAPNPSYVNNGTFINNTDIFPMLGYNPGLELSDTKDRKKRGLKEQAGLPLRSDRNARLVNLFGQRGRTNLDITIGTAGDQTAIAPGYLIKSWKAKDRAYFQYRMDKPIFNFFNIISGRLAVKRDKWKDVDLEIWYHKDHAFNLDVMLSSLKKGMDYNSKSFSPYSYRQVRIIEFPRYRSFAQSFANTIPFSESIGFIFKHQPDELDMGYYVTAHELGHQWWGHQVCESNTVGGQMYSEGLAQYSSLMVLKHTLPAEELGRYLKYELDAYLRGRSTEKKKENPLDQTDNQGYIHYNKASLAYFALQDYIGEENVNKALRKLIANYGDTDNYPTSDVLTGYFKELTPDSLKFVVDDLFSKITLFENRVINPVAVKKGTEFEVTIPVQTVKYYADKEGNEKATPIKDYIDIGIYALDKNGKEHLVYLKRHKFIKESNTIVVKLKDKPVRAGVDPMYKLVDRNAEDNKALITID